MTARFIREKGWKAWLPEHSFRAMRAEDREVLLPAVPPLAVPPVPAVQGRAPVPELKPVPVRERLPLQVTAARELRRYRQLHLSVIMR